MANPWEMDWSDATVMGSPAGGGKSNMSGAENQELVKARAALQSGRDVFPALGEMYRVASRYPGGIPQAVYDKARLATGSEAQKAQDFDLFNAYANRAAIGKARMLAPVSNADMQNLIRSGPNPRFRFQNNQQIIGLEYSNNARQYVDNFLKQRWAAENGGTNVPNKRGQSYEEWRAQVFRNPEVQRQITPPWLRKSAGKTKADTNGDGVVDFNDLK